MSGACLAQRAGEAEEAERMGIHGRSGWGFWLHETDQGVGSDNWWADRMVEIAERYNRGFRLQPVKICLIAYKREA